jgi:formylglycine-generating enzyme required for sulfatase activity
MTQDVGGYPGSPSPYGTFDPGGNVSEWTEALVGGNRSARGGNCNQTVSQLASAMQGNAPATYESNLVGFRVASLVLEPGTALLLGAGLAALARCRRRR